MSRFARLYVLLLVGVAVVVVVATARGATYVESCPSPADYTSEPAIAEARSCAVLSERLELIEAHTDTSLSALVDARALLGYCVGLLCSLLFAAIFLRTFARNV